MILLTTTLLLSLVTALIFSLQQAVWLYSKVHQKVSIRYQIFEALESEVLKWAEQGRAHTSANCSSKVLDVSAAMRVLKAGHGCVMLSNNEKYQYWVNKLGYADKQAVLAIRAISYPDMILSVRFSNTRGIMSWWVI
ncbi:MAG: hypothetical protein P1U32_04725 [Legionellaceae bacterium]|nr:hypothetical protein [Legionellaceae bacterium]